MGAALSCHYCGYDIDPEDLMEDPEDFSCPGCGAGMDGR